MKLNQMYTNVLDLNFAELELKVMADSEIRNRLIQSYQSMSKNDVAVKTTRLDDSEKAILKALGLSLRDIKILKEQI